MRGSKTAIYSTRMKARDRFRGGFSENIKIIVAVLLLLLLLLPPTPLPPGAHSSDVLFPLEQESHDLLRCFFSFSFFFFFPRIA